jgi:hypothetical protein
VCEEAAGWPDYRAAGRVETSNRHNATDSLLAGNRAVLLAPKKGTQGREMSRKSKIAVASTLSGLVLVGAPVAALAASPLLSGYGGPGAGEQAIIGATLSGGSSGGSGAAGGSAGSAGQGGASQSTGASAGASGATASGGTRALGSRSGSGRAPGHAGNVSHGAGSLSARAQTARPGAKPAEAFVYPSSLRPTSDSSPALGISGGDLIALLAALATLGVVGAVTIRLSRLQR